MEDSAIILPDIISVQLLVKNGEGYWRVHFKYFSNSHILNYSDCNNTAYSIPNPFIHNHECLFDIFKNFTGINFSSTTRYAFNTCRTLYTVDIENHCRIGSRVTKQSLFTLTHTLFHFLHAMLYSEHTTPPKNSPIADFDIVTKDSIFWRHHRSCRTSRERKCWYCDVILDDYSCKDDFH